VCFSVPLCISCALVGALFSPGSFFFFCFILFYHICFNFILFLLFLYVCFYSNETEKERV
jgi:hypothetical protein